MVVRELLRMMISLNHFIQFAVASVKLLFVCASMVPAGCSGKPSPAGASQAGKRADLGDLDIIRSAPVDELVSYHSYTDNTAQPIGSPVARVVQSLESSGIEKLNEFLDDDETATQRNACYVAAWLDTLPRQTEDRLCRIAQGAADDELRAFAIFALQRHGIVTLKTTLHRRAIVSGSPSWNVEEMLRAYQAREGSGTNRSDP